MIDLSKYFTQGDKWLYDTLFEQKREVFPDDYKLTFLYTQDQFNNQAAVGICLLKLQEYLSILDIPNFFVVLHTNNQNIIQELKLVKNLIVPLESDISVVNIPGTFGKSIPVKDSLCLYPWIHLYVNPQGQVGTCCEFNENHALGHLSTDSLTNIINGPALKKIRTQMLNNERPDICSSCWIKEDNNIKSTRQHINAKWSKYSDLPSQTLEDGTFENFKFRHIDFRASNVCNLRCRMCSGKFSSRIAQEEADIYGDARFIELKLNDREIIYTLDFIKEHINDIETIYFAGGEPLIMEEHYRILDLLIEHSRTDIAISYNTNLTVLKYKNLNVIDYWKKFSNIHVGASIDLIGPQANYVRSGTNYDLIEKNYYSIKDYVSFNITSIVHLFNIFNLPKLQYHWINNNKLNPKLISFRPLVYPPSQSLQVLPKKYKEKANIVIAQHISWLESVFDAEHLATSWQEVLNYMNADDQSHLLKEFFRLNDDKDQHRNENFEEVFPEYTELRSYV